MAIVTVTVKARRGANKLRMRRRLSGKSLQLAQAARRYIGLCLNHDGRLVNSGKEINADRLIFRNDANAVAEAGVLYDRLGEAVADQVPTIKSV